MILIVVCCVVTVFSKNVLLRPPLDFPVIVDGRCGCRNTVLSGKSPHTLSVGTYIVAGFLLVWRFATQCVLDTSQKYPSACWIGSEISQCLLDTARKYPSACWIRLRNSPVPVGYVSEIS
jgi:hypothetical protein